MKLEKSPVHITGLFYAVFHDKISKKGYPLITFEVGYKGEKQCAHCQGNEVRIKSSFIRQVRHHGIAEKPPLLKFQTHKFYCRCSKCYSNQRSDGISQKKLSSQFRSSKITIERLYLTQTILGGFFMIRSNSDAYPA